MSLIASVHARQILDSHGNPTIEVDVVTETSGSASSHGARAATCGG